mmetsp:Transcript_32849/g.61094  ORF Transcript_32849/g.61094 Transcript_32849/m.61094 type:complete len:102 (-) Transcript_32849:38-343(-)
MGITASRRPSPENAIQLVDKIDFANRGLGSGRHGRKDVGSCGATSSPTGKLPKFSFFGRFRISRHTPEEKNGPFIDSSCLSWDLSILPDADIHQRRKDFID